MPAAGHIPDVALDRGKVLSIIFDTYYYHDSNLGNVNQITDSSGAVVQTYDYDAFGNITNQTGSLTTKYAYKTKEYSPETGLIFFGARYYNPLIGRFITKDPLGMGDGPNQYIYCWNDPVNKIDPWGLCIDQNITDWVTMMNLALTDPEVLIAQELALARGSLAAFGLSNKSIVEEKINEWMNALKNISQKPNPNKVVLSPPSPESVKVSQDIIKAAIQAALKVSGNPSFYFEIDKNGDLNVGGMKVKMH